MVSSPSNLTLEQQEKLERFKIHLNSLWDLLGEKSSILTVISSVSAAILIIATFNPNLLPITTGFKIVITILLALIPTSLLFHLLEIFSAINNTNEAIKKMIGPQKENRRWHEIFYNGLIGYFPFIGTLLLGGVILYIVSIIW